MCIHMYTPSLLWVNSCGYRIIFTVYTCHLRLFISVFCTAGAISVLTTLLISSVIGQGMLIFLCVHKVLLLYTFLSLQRTYCCCILQCASTVLLITSFITHTVYMHMILSDSKQRTATQNKHFGKTRCFMNSSTETAQLNHVQSKTRQKEQ